MNTQKTPTAVRSSDLLAELEVALRRLIELRDGTSECWGWDDEWEQVKAALEHAVESEKGRSANAKLTDAGTKTL